MTRRSSSPRAARALGSLLALALALPPGRTFAEHGLRARATLLEADEAKARMIGGPLQIRIEARHAPGAVALLPEKLELPEALGERRRARKHERSQDGEVEVDMYRLELIPFRAGLIEIPPIPLALGSTVAETAPLLVQIASSLDEAEQQVATSTRRETLAALEKMAAGNPPPESVYVGDVRYALGLGALVALLLLLLLAKKLLDRRRVVRSRPASAPPRKPAHEEALEALEALQRSGRAERGEHNAFFTELSYIVRTYVGRRYDVDALERTVDELADALQTIPTPGLDRIRLKTLLEDADQVKFAKYRPRPDDVDRSLHDVRHLIESTRLDDRGDSAQSAEVKA